jgi:hypothetical protein
LYSSSFTLPQDSFISFTVWHSDLFLPIQWEIWQVFRKTRDGLS